MKGGDNIPLVSVITVTKNAEEYLEQSLLSVINQTYPNIEYLIFDGLSNDSTVDIIKKYDEYIDAWSSEADGSMYEAINKAITRSNGDIVAILNADDRYFDYDVVSHMVEAMAMSGADGIYGDLIVDYGDTRQYKKVFQVSFEEYLLSGKGTFVPHVTLFLKKSCFDEVGLYNQQYKYAADYDFMLRCLSQCRIKYCAMPVAIFRRHPGSITATGKIRAERINILRYYDIAKYPLLRKLVLRNWLWFKYYSLNILQQLFIRNKVN